MKSELGMELQRLTDSLWVRDPVHPVAWKQIQGMVQSFKGEKVEFGSRVPKTTQKSRRRARKEARGR